MQVERPSRRSDKLNLKRASDSDRLSGLTLDKQIFTHARPLPAGLEQAFLTGQGMAFPTNFFLPIPLGHLVLPALVALSF